MWRRSLGNVSKVYAHHMFRTYRRLIAKDNSTHCSTTHVDLAPACGQHMLHIYLVNANLHAGVDGREVCCGGRRVCIWLAYAERMVHDTYCCYHSW